MWQGERQVLRDAAILQVIAGELGRDQLLDRVRLDEFARALNSVASGLIAGQARAENN